MNFSFPLNDLMKLEQNGIIILDSLKCKNNKINGLNEIIDLLGIASSKAQQLSVPISSFNKLQISNHRIYLKINNEKVIGFIKVGKKDLFYRHLNGKFTEMQPLCVLDFYVHESYQRNGYGKIIFEKNISALNGENSIATDLQSFAAGTYLVSLFENNQLIASQKIIKN